MFEKATIGTLGEDTGTDEENAMNKAVMDAQEAISKYVGVDCDIAIAVHFHKDKHSTCSALVVTPVGTPIGLAAKTLYLGLGGLQMIMAEMPDQNETIN